MKRRCRSLAFVYVLGLALGASFASAQTEITPGPGAVTASTQDANVPGNTVDGSLATRWSGSGDGAWLRFDLGSTRVISHVRIAVYQGNTRRNRFEIQLAGEDLAWTTVWTGESSGTTTGEQTYDFDDRAARYVRYVGSGSSAGAWNSVTEVSLFAPATPAPTPTSTPTPSPTPSASPTATPTPVTPTPTPGGPTNGWTQISWTYKVQKPYDVDVSSRFSHANGVWTCWVFKTDKPHTTTSNTAPRTEMRWNNDYTSGNRMWDGDIYPVGGIDDAHIQQVFGGVVHATASMIMVFADGTLKRYDTGTIATGVLDKWTNVKVAHDANANNVKIYVGNVLKRTDPDRGNTTHYFKNGVYGLSSPPRRMPVPEPASVDAIGEPIPDSRRGGGGAHI